MKSKRLTIFCVALMVLAGTPRAWQEVNKLLAVIQHKAQVKLWSMVLQPRDKESARGELVAAVQLFEPSLGALDSDCALENQESQGERVSSSPKTTRRIDAAPAQSKARARKPSVVAPSSHADLIAKSFKALDEKSNAELLRHFKNRPESQPSTVVGAGRPAPLPGALAAPHPAMSKSDTFRFVMIPATSPVASSLVQKENFPQLKTLKKTLEENKWIRQKGRVLPVGRGVVAFPAS